MSSWLTRPSLSTSPVLRLRLPLRLGARHHAAGAVHGRVQALGAVLALDAREDDGVVAHRAADEAALARERRRRALAHHPQVTLAVALAPGVVVVVVHGVERLGARGCGAPSPPPTRGRHRRTRRPASSPRGSAGRARSRLDDHRRRDVDAVLAAGELEVVRRALVAEATRAEVHADPHVARLRLRTGRRSGCRNRRCRAARAPSA